MSKPISKIPTIQKPFRCPTSLDIQLNKAKGALMVRTGERISDNQFMIHLLELGLDRLREKIDMNFQDPQ